jgi:hypothetical protein
MENLLEKGAVLIAGGEKGIFKGPGDVEVWVIPAEGAFGFRIVGGAHFVVDARRFAEDAKTVGKAFGDEELLVVLVIELDRLPAHKSGGIGPDIDSDIPDGALDAKDEFILSRIRLVMEPAQGIFDGKRGVVLHERDGDLLFGKMGLSIAFKKEAPLVREETGDDEF